MNQPLKTKLRPTRNKNQKHQTQTKKHPRKNTKTKGPRDRPPPGRQLFGRAPRRQGALQALPAARLGAGRGRAQAAGRRHHAPRAAEGHPPHQGGAAPVRSVGCMAVWMGRVWCVLGGVVGGQRFVRFGVCHAVRVCAARVFFIACSPLLQIFAFPLASPRPLPFHPTTNNNNQHAGARRPGRAPGQRPLRRRLPRARAGGVQRPPRRAHVVRRKRCMFGVSGGLGARALAARFFSGGRLWGFKGRLGARVWCAGALFKGMLRARVKGGSARGLVARRRRWRVDATPSTQIQLTCNPIQQHIATLKPTLLDTPYTQTTTPQTKTPYITHQTNKQTQTQTKIFKKKHLLLRVAGPPALRRRRRRAGAVDV